MFKILHTIS